MPTVEEAAGAAKQTTNAGSPQLEAALSAGRQALGDRQPAPETHRARAKRFYSSQAWHALRFDVLRDNAQRHHGKPACDLCAAHAERGNPLDCDHIIPLSVDWSKRLDRSNVQILCRRCNFGKSNRDATDFRPAADAPA